MLGEVRSRWVAGRLATGLPIHSEPARAVGFPYLAGLTSLPLPSWLSHRTLKRKSSSMKRLSPAPQLGPSSDSHTSYYSESVVRESYIGSPRAASLARSALLDDRLHSERLHSEPYWSKYPRPPPEIWAPSSFPLSVPKRPFSGCFSEHPSAPGGGCGSSTEPRPLPGGDLRGRRRRGTGGSESSKANGLTTESKVSEDFFGSSSGYSSEDDFAGRCCLISSCEWTEDKGHRDSVR